MTTTQQLLSRLTQAGYAARVVSAERLATLEREIGALYQQGLIDRTLHEHYLAEDHDFRLLDRIPTIRSLIVVAAPRSLASVTFHRNGQEIPVKLSSSVIEENRLRERARVILAEELGRAGYQTLDVSLPEKLLAVHSGLGRYGRNNLCYVPGMGSLNSLAVFGTDLDCEQNTWQELAQLEVCAKCTACLRACPTQAITGDRFLLRAERCLAFFNERPGPFPEWVDPSWHNAVVGCLRCQTICPQNKPYAVDIERAAFSAEETDRLLSGEPLERLPEELADKLLELGLTRYYAVLSRNLSALLAKGLHQGEK